MHAGSLDLSSFQEVIYVFLSGSTGQWPCPKCGKIHPTEVQADACALSHRSLQDRHKCPDCGGSGNKGGYPLGIPCPRCRGTGEI